jgi:fluoride ion exporter CrcB/FEX
MPIAVAVALGGAAGAVARWGLDRLIERRSLAVFPWSTFAVNVSGCLLIGIVVAALVDRHHTPLWLRAGLVMGLLGGYTTSRPSPRRRSTCSAATRSRSRPAWPTRAAAWPPGC